MKPHSLDADDDITLFTDDEQVAVQRINHFFRQKSRLKGVDYEFTVFNGNQCYQKVSVRYGGKHKFRVDLACLDPQPRREFNLADSWLVFAAVCATLSLLLIYAGWIRQPPVNIDPGLLVILTSVSVGATLIALVVTLLKTHDRLVIYSYHGRAPVLVLINHNPDPRTFKVFLDSLSSCIEQSRRGSTGNLADMLALELKELRRLRNEGVIPDSQYESAKQRIFRNEAYPTDHAG